MISLKVLNIFRENCLAQQSLLKIIRAEPDDQKIIDTLIMLGKEDALTFSYGGDFPFPAMIIGIPPEEWNDTIKHPTTKNMLRRFYRAKITKKEIIRMRYIMWTVMPNFYYIEKIRTNNPTTWTYMFSSPKIWDIIKKYEYEVKSKQRTMVLFIEYSEDNKAELEKILEIPTYLINTRIGEVWCPFNGIKHDGIILEAIRDKLI